jgi:CRISPR-associated protein Cas2
MRRRGRAMRLIIMFDLPTTTKRQLKEYNTFRRFLLNSGFYMIQFSIYAKLCNNYDSLAVMQKWVEKNLPKAGNVRSLAVTENQYRDMHILVGETSVQEEGQNLEGVVII